MKLSAQSESQPRCPGCPKSGGWGLGRGRRDRSWAPASSAGLRSSGLPALSPGEVICEPPNNKLDKFSGTLYWKENKYPLSNQNMLLRGCMLRNTEWCFGLVVFAGPDTKLMQNSGRTKFKRTSIDRLMNTLVLWIFGFLVCMGVILAIGNAIWEHEVGARFQLYLPWDEAVDSAFFSGFLSFWSYIIILNTVVPISLYVR
ncbi:ATPase, class I, type 8B, member 2 [Chelydra serpentina]|uniref:ATPase, class I, type 8B, member 2 n=1 Tax=Chelydra serpentina TaxID=8475 RepID=A0A8T1RV63_CHESE|nr:ATPase, class I, type 8B, member 2 [Chelydra serpentina]